MATRTINVHTLVCDGDGCTATFGVAQPFASTIEARAAAYAEGWRFPARRKLNGQQATVSSDVCPVCLPGWQPAPTRGAAQ